MADRPQTAEEQTNREQWSNHGDVEVLRDGKGHFVTWEIVEKDDNETGRREMPQEITDIEQVEPGDIIGKGTTEWEVTGVEYGDPDDPFAGPRPKVDVIVANGDDDARMMPDVGATKTIRESQLKTGWEIRE